VQELIAEEAANRKDIEDVIEEERAKVDAKTPITQDVFLGWRQKNRDDKKRAREDTETERKRKGVMTGREIFAQASPSFLTMITGDSSFLPRGGGGELLSMGKVELALGVCIDNSWLLQAGRFTAVQARGRHWCDEMV